MGKTKEEMRKYKREWSKKHRLENPEYAKRQNERCARYNAKLRETKVYVYPPDISGKRFGRLVVIRLDKYYPKGSTWLCKCDCGNEVIVKRHFLTIGDTKSCGCLAIEIRKLRFKTHGDSGTKEYKCWAQMKSRCYNHKNKGYPDYGERGIKVCDRWLDSYENFLADVGRAPSKKHTLDRFPNNNGDYEPENIRWATHKQQSNNKRNNIVLIYKGESKTLTEWAEEIGIKRKRNFHRLISEEKMSIEEVVLLPTIKKQIESASSNIETNNATTGQGIFRP